MQSTIVYALFILSGVLLLIELAFFIMFLVSYIHHQTLSDSAQYSDASKEWTSHVKGIIALNFLMFFLAIAQFVFFFLAFKLTNFIVYIVISVACVILFFICWILSIVTFAISPEYEFIESAEFNFSGSDVVLYSYDEYLEQMKNWSQQNPMLYLHAVGSTEDHLCYGYINISTTQNNNNKFDNNDMNFNDISGDSFVMVDLEVNIVWNQDSQKKDSNNSR